MNSPRLYSLMSQRQQETLTAVRRQAETLLNCSPRFKLFTLHGSAHIDNLFRIADILLAGGVKLNSDEAFLLSLAICLHDVGMVVGLKDKEIEHLLRGRAVAPDPASLENEIREQHHEMVDIYTEKNFTFLAGLGLTPADVANVVAISRCHRKVVLHKQYGIVKFLGAIIRVIDELDVGPERAPISALQNMSSEMDVTSLWHWTKHNIVEGWRVGDNVVFNSIHGKPLLEFTLIVHPAKSRSSSYWLYQIRRPILHALIDDGCQQIIAGHTGVTIKVETSEARSTASHLGQEWELIEERALSGGRKVVLLIDDEVRKMEDLMLSVSLTYHVLYASNAADALSKCSAGRVDLAIVDMQIGGSGVWTPEETGDYKTTGINIIKAIETDFPSIRIGVLSGTRYDTSALTALKLEFVLKKPCDPALFYKRIKDVLG